jgi:hypothetical protein
MYLGVLGFILQGDHLKLLFLRATACKNRESQVK